MMAEAATTPAPESAALSRLTVEQLSEAEKEAFDRLCFLVDQCPETPSEECNLYETEEIVAEMCRTKSEFPRVFETVDAYGWSLMHQTAYWAKTEPLVRCVWECCGTDPLRVLRWQVSDGRNVLMCAAWNRNTLLKTFQFLVQQCEPKDLLAMNEHGCTVLFILAHRLVRTDRESPLSPEQEERIESMMGEVLRRAGPDAWNVATTKEVEFGRVSYRTGSTPASVLEDTECDEHRALLHRLQQLAEDVHHHQVHVPLSCGPSAAARTEGPRK